MSSQVREHSNPEACLPGFPSSHRTAERGWVTSYWTWILKLSQSARQFAYVERCRFIGTRLRRSMPKNHGFSIGRALLFEMLRLWVKLEARMTTQG